MNDIRDIIDLLNDVLDSMDAQTYSARELYNRIEAKIDELKYEDELLTRASAPSIDSGVEQCPVQ